MVVEFLAGADAAPAVRAGAASLDRSGLRREVADRVRSLVAAGIDESDCVLFSAAPGIEFITHLFAVLTIGAQPIVIDHRMSLELIRQLGTSQSVSHWIRSSHPLAPTKGSSEAPLDIVSLTPSPGRRSDHALIQLSSGTTDQPKLVGRSLIDLNAEVDRYRSLGGIAPEDSSLVVAGALSSAWGLNGALLAGLGSGHEVVLPLSTTPAGLFKAATTAARPAVILAVPTQVTMLGRAASAPRAALRGLLSSGGPVAAEIAMAASATLGVPVGQVYGSTETGLIAADLRGEAPGTCGYPAAGLTLRLTAKGGLLIEMSKSPYRSRDDDAGRWKEGWLSTNDAVEYAPDGRLWVRGRTDGLLTLGGKKFHVTEIEHHLRSDPAIDEALVFVDDARVEAFVVAAPGVEVDRDRVSSRLPDYLRPHLMHVVDVLPRSPSGKILRRRALLDTVEGGKANA